MTPSALILDLDGTLIDSNDAHARAWVAALKDGGFERTFEEVRPLIGMGGDGLLDTLAGVSDDSEQGQQMKEAWKRHFLPMVPQLQAMPGARDLLEALRERGTPYILGSSGEQELTEALLKQAGLQDLMTGMVTSSDVERSKPHPDILMVALQKLNLNPDRALMVGDTKYDAEAARRAGVPCVLLSCGGSLEHGEAPDGVMVYPGPAGLAGALDSL
ncbi:HAD family hydrolase [Deinococcus sonorensis]|uniref:HAD family hydrolase n=2 Tax=Deinococcus sonorensis TaxID=309891 RepID=A0AAU7U9L0_9DEIO